MPTDESKPPTPKPAEKPAEKPADKSHKPGTGEGEFAPHPDREAEKAEPEPAKPAEK